ncbi:MAG: hypothetical protein JXA46_17660 [Dehalococcoidales bacterium]|nr:hypothetical protein [Dehalococcoidales bacterium]
MMAEVATTKNLRRAHGRGVLLSALEKDNILTKVMVFPDGRFITKTKLWDEYWQSVYELKHEKVAEDLNKLHIIWNDYIHFRFNASLRQDFCYRYFTLLGTLLSLHAEFIGQEWKHGLQATLGFECFGIASVTDNKVFAGGICTLRNPCYLLVKLKMPEVLNDPQYLPVITVPDIEEPELFYHYRQYALSHDSPLSLFLYPAASGMKRLASLKLIHSLVGGMSDGIDPRTLERAHRLYRHIIRRIIEANGKMIVLEIADIGAGSGSLSAAICREIQNSGVTPKLRVWFVDLEHADPSRFLHTKKLRAFSDNLNYIGDNYRNWLARPRPLPVKNGLRIALVSKLFNNLSLFSVRCLSGEQLSPFHEYPDPEKHRPSICLAPHGAGIESLAVSNTRIQLQEGRAFSQASLSEFYEGLYVLSGKSHPDEAPENRLFLPVRLFHPECLITSNSKSVIACLTENCDYVIIEDADLRPQELIDHAIKYSLSSLIIYDMTKALRLKGNYLYVIWNSKAVTPHLSGEQIW